MKIAIKVSDISSLLNYNSFKSREIVIKNIKSRLFRSSKVYDDNIYGDINNTVENFIESYIPIDRQIHMECISGDIIYKEFDNFYIYCFRNEIEFEDVYIRDRKYRISQKVKNFIPLIDLIHIQFYLLLTQCRRCLLDEVWEDGHTRKTFIKYNTEKLNTYIYVLNEVVLMDIIN